MRDRAAGNLLKPRPTDWKRVSRDPEFRDLVALRWTFALPATVFFVAYYFALPVLVGYWPALMARPVIGPVNLAYLFALSQFFMAWIVAGLYLRAAGELDDLGRRIAARHGSKRNKR